MIIIWNLFLDQWPTVWLFLDTSFHDRAVQFRIPKVCRFLPCLYLADIWTIRCQLLNSHAVRHGWKNRFQIIIGWRWSCMGDKLSYIIFSWFSTIPNLQLSGSCLANVEKIVLSPEVSEVLSKFGAVMWFFSSLNLGVWSSHKTCPFSCDYSLFAVFSVSISKCNRKVVTFWVIVYFTQQILQSVDETIKDREKQKVRFFFHFCWHVSHIVWKKSFPCHWGSVGNHFHWPYILLVFSEELEIRKWKLRKWKFRFEVGLFPWLGLDAYCYCFMKGH